MARREWGRGYQGLMHSLSRPLSHSPRPQAPPLTNPLLAPPHPTPPLPPPTSAAPPVFPLSPLPLPPSPPYSTLLCTNPCNPPLPLVPPCPALSPPQSSLKAGGVGMNLTAASAVHLMDPWWNPAVEEQAMVRAGRGCKDWYREV